MDIVYADSSFNPQGLCQKGSLDVAWGVENDENELSLTMSLTMAKKLAGANTIPYGSFIFVPETEWGGIVDAKEVDTTADPNEITFSGRSWHGIMSHSIIKPDSGVAYYTVSGTANDIVATLISRQGLGDIFVASDEDSPTVSSFQFARYTDLYSGLRKLAASIGCRVEIVKSFRGKCVVGIREVDSLSEQVDNNYTVFKMKRDNRPINHLVCLGGGTLADRTVIDLYADESGAVSQTQTLFGIDEVAEVYDYSSVEDDDELLEQGTEKLEDYQTSSTINIDIDDGATLSIGDTITAKSTEVNLSVEQSITKVMVAIDEEGFCEVSYKVGEASTEDAYE